ncbi:YSIRK signal domain/LPXTG anchor domain surface protein [Staphylococcus haemolyticus]|nr:putative Ig domain-containing protein [Staphylococcus haemolyticus]PTK82728.1 YSIRK signal domain/LPXTG anchor domain surface protein [Staphylococcus haemolyticus]
MKNRQGFLPNILNKYSIRKFSVGTASLLIGATLVMGAGNVARADELDKITAQDDSNKDKSEAVDISELTNNGQTESNVTEVQSDETSNQTIEDKNIKSTVEETSEEKSTASTLSDKTLNSATSDNDQITTQKSSTTQDNQKQDVTSSNGSNAQTSNDSDQSEEKSNSSTDSAKNANDEKAKEEPVNDKEISESNQTTQSLDSKDDSKTNSASDTQKDTTEITKDLENNKNDKDNTSSTNKASDNQSSKDNTTDDTSSKNDSNSSSDNKTATNTNQNSIMQSQDSGSMVEDKPVITEANNESPIPLNSNSTSMVNSQATTSTVRNNRMKFRVLAAVKDGKVVKYKIPTDSKYAYLLQDLGYDATTVKEDTDLRHAGINQMQNNETSVIKLNLSKWLALQSDFVNGGKVNLSFSQSDFFTQIQSITLNGVNMTTTNNGQNWSAPITGSTVNSGLIGSVSNHDVLITLKNNQTLKSLGYSNDKPVYLTHTWTENDGSIAEESIQITTITPTLNSKAPQTTQTSGFTTGRLTNKVKYDSTNSAINSVHTFKPDENFLQTDYNWVLYIKEQVPKDLLPYIDASSVKIYVSDDNGNPISSDRYVNGTIDSNGFFDSSTIDSISILKNNTSSQLNSARTSLDRNVFYGTLGQSRSYTISYKLKSGYTLENLASQLSDRETFNSWLVSDYLDSNDNGAVNKRILGSYASSYLDIIDRVAPVAPTTAKNITTEDKTISGTGEANMTIQLDFSDGRKLTGQIGSDGKFTVAVPSGFTLTGKETISATVLDKGSNVSPATTITVKDTTKPVVTAITNQMKEVNTSIDSITIVATDNSGDAVTNSVSGLPSGVTFNSSTNTISGTPTKVGNYTITITSTDSSGNSTTTPFTITVVDTTTPVITPIGNQTKEVNTPINSITIIASDNSKLAVTNNVSGLPDGVTFDSTTNRISGTPTKVGTYPITVTSTDANGNAMTTNFTISIVDTTKPVVTPISNQTKEVDTAIDPITIEATDNSGQPVTNSVSGLPDGVTFDRTTNKISGTPTKVGTYPITITTTDASGNAISTEFNIKVIDTIAPIVSTIESQTKEVNTVIDVITIDATDNSGQPVTNSVNGLPDGVTFDNTTNSISGTPTKVGDYPITVTTTDASGNTATTKFNITVVDTTSPTVTPIVDQTKEVNTAIDSITIDATDNSGQSVTNNVTGLPSGVTFNNATNTISGIPSKVGNYPITVTTTDASGNTTTTIFNIKVVDTTKPVVTKIEDQTKEVNTPIKSIIISATDNSKLAVTNNVSGLPDGVTFDSSTNKISGTPTKVGSYLITVTSTDTSGNATTTLFNITVQDTTKPVVSPIAGQTKEVNTAIDPIKIEASDNSGQAVTNKVSGLPTGVTFNPDTNTISGTPSKVGSYPITVTTTDADGNETTTSFTITVQDTTAPTVKAIGNQTKEVNTAIDSIKIDATDNSGQAVTNKVSGLPAGVTFNPNTNIISGTPTKVGSYPITVTTTDADGNETETSFTITVQDTTKPVVSPIAGQTKEVNTAIDPIKIDATDNSGQAVTNKVSGLPSGVTFNPDTNTISGTPTKVGSYPITVTTTDADGNETETSFTITVQDTTAPTVKAIGNQTKEVNIAIDSIKIDATDNSGQAVTNKVTGLPAGVTFNPDTNTISGTPSKVGSYPITVTTTDADGNETETSFTITVQDTTKPVVSPIAGQTKEVNTAIDVITIDATDNSGQAVTNKVSGLPAGVTFNSATNTISGTPSKVGSYPITVTTTDADGNETTTSFTLTVEDTTAPTVKAIGNQTKEVNTAIDPIKIDATDNSGQAVTNKVSGLPTGVTFNPDTNTISGTPSKVGSYPITVTTTDADGNETTTSFTITVQDTTAPTVSPIAGQTKEVNTAINPIKIDATDNSGQAVTNKVSGLPTGVTFNPDTNTISGTPSKVGSYPITVTTTDADGNETTTSFTLTVEDTTAPTVKAIGNQTKEVNTAIDPIKIDATDNSGQAVTNKVSGLPTGVTFNPDTNTISGTPSKVGSYPITVTTTDADGNETTTSFTITVQDTTAPTVKAIGNQTKEVNTAIDSIKIDATDNSGQAVTNKVSGLPSGVTFNPDTNTISGTPTKVGSYPITVTTTDADGNETETSFTITVKDTTKPVVSPIAGQTKEVNTAIDPIKIDATDNSGQAVTNKVSGLPSGVTFNPDTNTISGTPTKVGSYPITVTTTDADGNETETSFTITVQDTTAPTVKAIGNQIVEVNTAINPITIDATDNSGQPVTISVSGLPAGVTFNPETNTISRLSVLKKVRAFIANADNGNEPNTINGTPTKVGIYPVTVTITDASGNKTTMKFTITVQDTVSPIVSPIGNQTKEINAAIDPITIDATDNSGQPVTNKVTGLPTGVTYNPETNTISGTPTKVGSYPITVITTDDYGNETETSFIITVQDTTAPTVKAIGNQTKEINTAIDPITIDATDNSGQPVTNKITGLPTGVTYNPETNTISGIPTKVGSYPITVTTTDTDGNESTTSFTITVHDTTAPIVAPIDNQTKEVNTSISPIKIDVKDNSGLPVKINVIGLPESVTFDSETNTIYGTPSIVGSYEVTVIATDANGNEVTTAFNIMITDKVNSDSTSTSESISDSESTSDSHSSTSTSESMSDSESTSDSHSSTSTSESMSDSESTSDSHSSTSTTNSLPNTGEEKSDKPLLLSLITGLGLLLFGRRRKKEDEDEAKDR